MVSIFIFLILYADGLKLNDDRRFDSSKTDVGGQAEPSTPWVGEKLNPWYGANAALNSGHIDLAVIGASLLPTQLLQLMDKGVPAKPATVVEGFEKVQQHMQSVTGHAGEHKRLESCLRQQGSDKHIWNHQYQAFYAPILDMLVANKAAPIATLEIGLGTNSTDMVSNMGAHGRPGASNRAFREYLPKNAHIYGGDVDRKVLYHEDRIDTAYVDQLNLVSFDKMKEELGESSFDLIIDDGLHSLAGNINTLLFALDHVRPGGWVVVEDVPRSQRMTFLRDVVDATLRENPKYRTLFASPGKMWAYLVQRID